MIIGQAKSALSSALDNLVKPIQGTSTFEHAQHCLCVVSANEQLSGMRPNPGISGISRNAVAVGSKVLLVPLIHGGRND